MLPVQESAAIVLPQQLMVLQALVYSGQRFQIEKASFIFSAAPLKITSYSQNQIRLKTGQDTYSKSTIPVGFISYQSLNGGCNGKNGSINYKDVYTVTLVKNEL